MIYRASLEERLSQLEIFQYYQTKRTVEGLVANLLAVDHMSLASRAYFVQLLLVLVLIYCCEVAETKRQFDFKGCGGSQNCLGAKQLEQLRQRSGLAKHGRTRTELAKTLDDDDDLVSCCCCHHNSCSLCRHSLWMQQFRRQEQGASLAFITVGLAGS